MQTAAAAIAEKLLEIDAVKLRPTEPFTWASGWKSPVYCDNRRALAFPQVRDLIKAELCAVIFEKFPAADAIAGVATAGISWGALAADQLKLPFMYVRPQPKSHGMGNQIEGAYHTGQRLVVVEDLISTGKSSLEVCNVLRAAGLHIEGMVSIFNYNFPAAAKAFNEADIPLESLSNYETLAAKAQERGFIKADDMNALLNWRADPAAWRPAQ